MAAPRNECVFFANYSNLPLSRRISKQILIFLLAVSLGLAVFPDVVLGSNVRRPTVRGVLVPHVLKRSSVHSRFSVGLPMGERLSMLGLSFLVLGLQ